MITYSNYANGNSEDSPLAFVIEDEPSLATIFALALDKAGYRVEIIREGRQALKQLAVTEPYIVILDLHLPYVSGESILQYIRNDSRLAKTQVIITTADALQAELLHKKADLVLLKPVSFQQLRDLAARLRPPDTLGIISEG
jgi:chemosensory pili system protein ChpA (sensor histidine kinase/response regulator)